MIKFDLQRVWRTRSSVGTEVTVGMLRCSTATAILTASVMAPMNHKTAVSHIPSSRSNGLFTRVSSGRTELNKLTQFRDALLVTSVSVMMLLCAQKIC